MAMTVRPVEVHEGRDYQKKTVETMSDAEIREKLCIVRGGCVKCECLTHCRYGREAIRRGVVKS